jgi:hypothetical protein
MIKKSVPKKASPAKKVGPSIMTIGSDYSDPRSDMHTLKSAEQIKADPKRHAAAVNHAKAEVGALQKVARKKV